MVLILSQDSSVANERVNIMLLVISTCSAVIYYAGLIIIIIPVLSIGFSVRAEKTSECG